MLSTSYLSNMSGINTSNSSFSAQSNVCWRPLKRRRCCFTVLLNRSMQLLVVCRDGNSIKTRTHMSWMANQYDCRYSRNATSAFVKRISLFLFFVASLSVPLCNHSLNAVYNLPASLKTNVSSKCSDDKQSRGACSGDPTHARVGLGHPPLQVQICTYWI